MYLLSALLIGFLGSFHCVAMCGPIALALTGKGENNHHYILNRSIYNLGRILTYAILGLFVGVAGKVFLLGGFQKSVSITIGLLMIIVVAFTYYFPFTSRITKSSMYLSSFAKKLLSSQLKKRNGLSFLFTGMANGFLPCGFVYIALAGAAITQSPVEASSYMIMFGLGTFPAMMLISVLGKLAGFKFRSIISRISPVLMILLGLFFIYRGLMISEGRSCHDSSISFKQNKVAIPYSSK